jgi:murein DD-endopeptidase MepM/ murein hydrolase activator NlpD
LAIPGSVLMKTGHTQTFGRRTGRAASFPLTPPSLGWKSAGAIALLCSGVAWASLPRPAEISNDQQLQWRALGVKPLSDSGASGMRMVATDAVRGVDYVPERKAAPEATIPPVPKPAASVGPLRIRGRVGDGLYWSLRAAGAAPDVAAQYLAALATEIDVGEVAANDSFDMVLGRNRDLLYAGLDRGASSDLQLVRWKAGGQSQWIDAANADQGAPVYSSAMLPVAGHITSYFGYRYHPILHFTRFHAGVDIGAGWGSPIVAAGDGEVVGAGWAGGYGRQVRIIHAGGLVSSYSHMSEIVATPGTFVRAGQLIGYVGSSGLSTGPHLHYEVRRQGIPVNPLGVRFTCMQVADTGLMNAVKARLKALLSVGTRTT